MLPQAPPLITLILVTLLVGLMIGHAVARHVQLARLVDAEDEVRDLRKELTATQHEVNAMNAILNNERRVSDAVTAEQARVITELSTSHLRKASEALLTIVSKYELEERKQTIEMPSAKRRTLPAGTRARAAN